MGRNEHFRGFSIEEQTDIWARWRKEESLSEIGRSINKHDGTPLHFMAALVLYLVTDLKKH